MLPAPLYLAICGIRTERERGKRKQSVDSGRLARVARAAHFYLLSSLL